MNTDQYLERIKYISSVDLTSEVLSGLQFAHLLHVPFENLDIHNHTPIKLSLASMFNKIVLTKRGGFCYELNGLFYELLKALGFSVKMVSARVYNGKGGYTPEFDHMALIVHIKNDDYLADVGFGEFIDYPVKIKSDKETTDPRGIFRIETFDENYKVISKKNADGVFIPEYIFTEKERQLDEFMEMCRFHQTSTESHFTKKRVCSLPILNGRITLTGDVLKITENGNVQERKLNNEFEIRQALWDHFGIQLS